MAKACVGPWISAELRVLGLDSGYPDQVYSSRICLAEYSCVSPTGSRFKGPETRSDAWTVTDYVHACVLLSATRCLDFFCTGFETRCSSVGRKSLSHVGLLPRIDTLYSRKRGRIRCSAASSSLDRLGLACENTCRGSIDTPKAAFQWTSYPGQI